MSRMTTRLERILAWTRCVLALLVGVVLGMRMDRHLFGAEADRLRRVVHSLRAGYVEEIPEGRMLEHSVRGIAGWLSERDPHTQYLPPAVGRWLEEESRGEICGIGVTLAEGEGSAVRVVEGM